jgi:hypothetical protein
MLQSDALEQVSRGFREYSQMPSGLTLVLSILLAAGAAAALVYAFFSGRDRMIGHRTFLRLAKASGLVGEETRLLVSVSRRVLPDNPPEIFVRRSLFETAVATMTADAAVVESVRKKVYGP